MGELGKASANKKKERKKEKAAAVVSQLALRSVPGILAVLELGAAEVLLSDCSAVDKLNSLSRAASVCLAALKEYPERANLEAEMMKARATIAKARAAIESTRAGMHNKAPDLGYNPRTSNSPGPTQNPSIAT